MKYDKSICINNIYALAKERNIKIGDLETKGNMSAGYLSRLNKKDNTSNPGVDALAVMADELGVTLDALISIDLESLSSTEAYFLKIVQKLLIDTEHDNISWECDAKSELLDIDDADCPLVEVVQDPETEYPYVYYKHVAPTDGRVDISGNFFRTELYQRVWLYITDVSYCDKSNVHEIFIQEGNREPTALCSTYAMREELATFIDKLYAAAEKAITRPSIKADVKGILDAYLGGQPYEARDDEPTPIPPMMHSSAYGAELSDEDIPF